MEYLRIEWESDTRYYLLEVSKDMFGYWVIKRLWSSKYAKSGQSRITSSTVIEEIEKMVNDISKRRRQRGYQIIEKCIVTDEI